MNILLTGEPHVGKSTSLSKIVSEVINKHGFVTNEVAENGQRTGFELVSSIGNKALLASTSSTSHIRVSKYGVNVKQFDDFLAGLGAPDKSALLYIDEIGQMELFSDNFKRLTEDYLARPNPFIGTLTSAYEDEFTEALRSRSDVEIIHMTFENRDNITAEIQARAATYALLG